MNTVKILQQTQDYVKEVLRGESSGHDWWHIVRVRNMALQLAKSEGADAFIVEMASLLHDVADRKLNNGDERAGLKKVELFLRSCEIDQTIIGTILSIIETYSYTNHLKNNKGMRTIEGKVVQDADRLDAIGALGIARTFSYGGHAGRPFYDPSIQPRCGVSAKEYADTPSPTINHFYEKLLLLKDLMNTKTAKKLAAKRHVFMEQFLDEFYKEWEGNL